MTARTRKRPAPAPAFGALDYPSSDGEPVAESDWHLHLLFESTTRLGHRYADDPDVYVSGNLLVYYQEGDTRLRLAPDCFVAFGVEKGERDTFKTWVEQAYRDAVTGELLRDGDGRRPRHEADARRDAEARRADALAELARPRKSP